MTIYCEHRGCGHHAVVDLEGIQAKHGDDFSASGLVARSRCGRCGARQGLSELCTEGDHAASV
jgi:hypothetical protein